MTRVPWQEVLEKHLCQGREIPAQTLAPPPRIEENRPEPRARNDPRGPPCRAAAFLKGYRWRMDWSVHGIALQPGVNRIVVSAEDIKGLTTPKTLTVTRK